MCTYTGRVFVSCDKPYSGIQNKIDADFVSFSFLLKKYNCIVAAIGAHKFFLDTAR